MEGRIRRAWDEIEVDGVPVKAARGVDEAGRPISWVTVELVPAGRPSPGRSGPRDGVKPTFFRKK